MVTATKPGSTVPVRIMRDAREQTLNVTVDELDLEAESNIQQQSRGRGGRGGPEPETTAGFGLTLDNITPDIARQLRLDNPRGAVVVDVDPNSPAARAGLNEGDVILRVGRTPVSNAADAQRELAKVPAGGTAFLRILRDGQETFVPVTKE
jgi:serine protease Do